MLSCCIWNVFFGEIINQQILKIRSYLASLLCSGFPQNETNNYVIIIMDKNDREHLFNQFYLYKVNDLNLTKTSSYSKVDAYVSGCLRRQNL